MSTLTPANRWRYELYRGLGAHVIRESRTDGAFDDYIATTWGGPNEGRARLIAAAPETAEKAMAFTLLLERFLRDDTGMPGVSESELWDAMYDLRSHIAKATGAAQ